ncbi:MAG: hypothetical protein EOM68_24850 [Spirochaetia bacterium]|nr:hypothetical protein [Spirochaetia bacterium]
MVYVPPNYRVPVVSSQSEVLKPDAVLNTEGNQIEAIYPVFAPAEKLALGLLRPHFEPMGVQVVDQHTKDFQLPLIIARATRQGGATGNIPGDSRFIRSIRLQVTAIMDGVNADDRCSKLLEAVQHVIFNAWHNQTVVPGVGSITHFDNFTEPSRVSDFQTATNIVQYASLPRGDARYEQNFNILIRPDASRSVDNEFIIGPKMKGA